MCLVHKLQTLTRQVLQFLQAAIEVLTRDWGSKKKSKSSEIIKEARNMKLQGIVRDNDFWSVGSEVRWWSSFVNDDTWHALKNRLGRGSTSGIFLFKLLFVMFEASGHKLQGVSSHGPADKYHEITRRNSASIQG